MGSKHTIVFIIGILTWLPHFSQAQNAKMSPIEVYSRCYMQLTGLIPNPAEDRYKKVKAKSLAPATACQQVFDLARLATNGVMKNRTNEVARRVLERIHTIHRNWFTEKKPTSFSVFSSMVIDYEEPALYYTRASLMDGQRYDSIFTFNSGLKGYRGPLNGTRLSTMESKRLFGLPSYFDPPIPSHIFRLAYYQWRSTTVLTREVTPRTMNIPDSKMTMFGVLQGVVPQGTIALPNYFMVPFFARMPLERQKLKDASGSITINKHFGGGILGSQAFVQTNTNLTLNLVPNGEEIIHRRLASRIYQDLLCHELPTLVSSDVTRDVVKSSPYPFRQTASCMQCHTSIDPTAFAYRNLALGRTISANVTDRIHGYHVETVLQSPVLNNPDYFASQTPSGAYAYRTLLDKKLVRGNVSSIQGLANHIKTANDFYLCSAKKYYKYFTGVDVQLKNREPAGTPQDRHQKMVISLSQKLKSTQSLSQMLKDLFNSSVYQNRDFLSTEIAK